MSVNWREILFRLIRQGSIYRLDSLPRPILAITTDDDEWAVLGSVAWQYEQNMCVLNKTGNCQYSRRDDV